MDMLAGMRVVGAVARQGSFTSAATELGLSSASISRIVAELEADLGVRLFNRTTRKMSLTDTGQDFVQRSTGILEEVDTLRGQARERHDAPRGTLRISSVTSFGNACLAPAIPDFLSLYPDLKLSLEISTRFVDLVEEHFDVAIRVGWQRESSLIAKKICAQRIVFVATPDYCRRFGSPQTFHDLQKHRSIIQISGEWGRVHKFRYGNNIVEFEPSTDVVVSSPEAARNATLTGYGYCLTTDFSVAKDIAEGRLLQLLPDYEPVEQILYATFPHRHYLPAKVRVFVDFLVERFASSKQLGDTVGANV